MNHRDETFKRKFADAARCFGVKPSELISLKVRENVSSYSEYHKLLERMEREFGIRWKPINADLQGKGYLLSDGAARAIMVEHESGLEILYIAGSIASLVGLVPILLQGWRSIRRSLTGRHHGDIQNIEIRRLDEHDHLIEDHIHDTEASFGIPNKVLTEAAKTIENDLRQMTGQIQSLTRRIEILEKKATAKKPRAKTGVSKRKSSIKSR